jgi:hypothetical protein
MSSPVALLRGADGAFVDGVFHDRIDLGYARLAQAAWNEYVKELMLLAAADGLLGPAYAHLHWNWQRKVAATENLLACPTFAVECEGQVQGMMLINTDEYRARIGDEAGKSLVYIYFVSTAPWNLGHRGEQKRFHGVGQILLRAAILQSIELGHKGRIGLHSLPQSEAFYEKYGFMNFGPDPLKDGLKYYELGPAAAAKFVA